MECSQYKSRHIQYPGGSIPTFKTINFSGRPLWHHPTLTMPSTLNHGHDDGYDYDLGSFQRKVSTKSPAAQRWFDRGLTWSYAFNHLESARCFQAAVDSDPTCAMAYWGLAYALVPNYNKP